MATTSNTPARKQWHSPTVQTTSAKHAESNVNSGPLDGQTLGMFNLVAS